MTNHEFASDKKNKNEISVKIEQLELVETDFKTKRKFQQAGRLRLIKRKFTFHSQNGFDILEEICGSIDCNFIEVLDAINRTMR